MFATLRRKLKWGSTKTSENMKNHSSLILKTFIGIIEDVIFWKSLWLSLSFIFLLNVIFFVCVHQQINLLQFISCLCVVIVSIDAFETWLKYKHRTTCLKRLADHERTELNAVATQINNWLKKKWLDFIYLREINNTKAFLLANIILSVLFLIGKYISGYMLIYMIFVFLCFFHKLAPPLIRFIKKIHLNAESDVELEELIPDVSEVDIKLLTFETEQNQVIDEKQSLDYWKPVDVPLEEMSDSSENSSSIVTNLSLEKAQTFEKDVETSDSSEEEYMPLVQQKDQLQSTLEEVRPTNSWGNTAYVAFRNLTGAVANMMYTMQEDTKKNRVSSIDSLDGFEMIDKNDLN